MTRIMAFPPILPERPHTLILGTMPGGRSLEAGQYYAHPQNQFWRILGEIYGAMPQLDYEERVEILQRNGIAVWDVLDSCERAGSMDADIKNPVVNDFNAFYDAHPTIDLVVFDSATAENFYRRHVLPVLRHHKSYRRAPSPSPAHARIPFAQKLDLWKAALHRDPNFFTTPPLV